MRHSCDSFSRSNDYPASNVDSASKKRRNSVEKSTSKYRLCPLGKSMNFNVGNFIIKTKTITSQHCHIKAFCIKFHYGNDKNMRIFFLISNLNFHEVKVG